MSLFYKISDKELLKIRNNIFIESGLPALEKNGFEKSPFPNSWFGKNNLGDYTYELCRLIKDSQLEFVTTHISKGDLWIKIFLNIFTLQPNLNSLKPLNGIDGIQFDLPPNSISKMRLRIDDFGGMPLFRTKEHKTGSFYTKKGFDKRIMELSNLIEIDLNNIDFFVKRWHEMHEPLETNWSGIPAPDA